MQQSIIPPLGLVQMKQTAGVKTPISQSTRKVHRAPSIPYTGL